jgi:predicted Zn-ribbon and HTH transcriptional regulator
MGRIRLDTISDFHKHGYDLAVMCRACGHKVVLTPGQLMAVGILGSVEKIEKRLRCHKCKARAAAISSTMLGPSGGVRRGASWKEGVKHS